MLDFTFECTEENDLICFRASGFALSAKILFLKDEIIKKLESMKGSPYRVMFDLRGLKALDPRAVSAMAEIDRFLCSEDCTAIKMGTVLDSILAKIQHVRMAKDADGKRMMDSGRAKFFDNYDECRAWLNA